LVAGRTYYLEVVGYDGNGTPLFDPNLNLSRNALVINGDDGGGYPNSRIVFTATQTGNYSVDVFGFGENYTGDYHLLINEDDYKGTVDGDGLTFNIFGVGRIGAVNTGTSLTGTINYSGDTTYGLPGDADLFSANLISGLTYTIEMRGSATGDGSLDDPYLYLLDSGGNLITQDDDSGLGFNSAIVYQAQYSGAHHMEAHSYASFDTGDYRILVSAGVGSAVADSITGLASNDAVNGAGGNDTVLGGGGSDLLVGASGNDLLRGQAGADVLRGGAGADVLIGGGGNDRFDFDFAPESTPVFRDSIRAGDGASAFEGAGYAGGDRIDLSGIDANANVGGNQAFHLGGGSFVGRLTLTNLGAHTLVQGNTDSDAAIEFSLLIEDGASANASLYRAADFIL
jgi:Ca2+-binding RTX toxin-like protein